MSIWPIDTEDFLRKEFNDVITEDSILNEGYAEYLLFESLKGIKKLIRDYGDAIKDIDYEKCFYTGDYMILKLTVNPESTQQRLKELIAGIKFYRNLY